MCLGLERLQCQSAAVGGCCKLVNAKHSARLAPAHLQHSRRLFCIVHVWSFVSSCATCTFAKASDNVHSGTDIRTGVVGLLARLLAQIRCSGAQ